MFMVIVFAVVDVILMFDGGPLGTGGNKEE